MTILVAGASGATGKLLVKQLLDRGVKVKALVRSPERLPEALRNHPGLTLLVAGVLDLSDAEMAALVKDCGAVVSCLGHPMTFKGVFGHPRRLVTEATRRLCEAIQANSPEEPVRFVLMNTAGNSNRDLDEPVSFLQRCVVALLRFCIPPHADNEEAADYLRTNVGQRDRSVEWVAVRPDGLIDNDVVTDYELHASPARSAIFDAGKTSRIHVARFMTDLVMDRETWRRWKGRMPVIYDKA